MFLVFDLLDADLDEHVNILFDEKCSIFLFFITVSLQNTTIEERVALLKIQVVEIEEDISILIENDDFLFDEQVIQDERLLNLEETSDQVVLELAEVNVYLLGKNKLTLPV